MKAIPPLANKVVNPKQFHTIQWLFYNLFFTPVLAVLLFRWSISLVYIYMYLYWWWSLLLLVLSRDLADISPCLKDKFCPQSVVAKRWATATLSTCKISLFIRYLISNTQFARLNEYFIIQADRPRFENSTTCSAPFKDLCSPSSRSASCHPCNRVVKLLLTRT